MSALAGLFFACSGLLGVAGVFKLLRPSTTQATLLAVGLPGSRRLVQAVGGAELAIGAGALLGVRGSAVLVMAAYLSLAGFVGLAMRRGLNLASCGCFGRADAPPTVLHLAVNLGAAVVAGMAAFASLPGLMAVLGEQPAGGFPLLLLIGLTTYLLYLALTALPTARAAIRLTS
ncbi:MAG: MauE/DoxX family redox-associated membrane protein [Actinomycetota bacterium]